MKVTLVVAYDSMYGIGKNGKIPWDIRADMIFFEKLTTNACVVMGRKTWESIPYNKRGLKNRINIIISKTKETLKYENNTNSQVYIARNMKEIEEIYNLYCNSKEIYIIGGNSIYKYFLENYNLIKDIYITKINYKYNCDTFMPNEELMSFFKNNKVVTEKIISEKTFDKLNNIEVEYEIHKNSIIKYEEINIDENNYLNLLKNILEQDMVGRMTRNGKTYSIFGPQLEFNLLNNTLPLLTTRKMFLRGIFEELIFFIQGQTDTKLLENKGVKIWKSNTTSSFLKSRNLDYDEGFMGPMYGFQWRYFGAEYNNGKDNYIRKGYDQLYNLIKVLIQEPYSRRHLLTTYNPSMVEQSVLAPCHGLVIQFYVQNEYLDCKMYQRSCDTVLGEPFNITSYALLTHLIAYICGYKARKLIITLGDAHIYEQHIEGVREQMKRKPYMFPKLNIKKKYEGYENMKIEDRIRYLESLVFDDIEVVDYECYPSIKFDMVA
jgi:dihydrofolate reductase/thymidylate synthase